MMSVPNDPDRWLKFRKQGGIGIVRGNTRTQPAVWKRPQSRFQTLDKTCCLISSPSTVVEVNSQVLVWSQSLLWSTQPGSALNSLRTNPVMSTDSGSLYNLKKKIIFFVSSVNTHTATVLNHDLIISMPFFIVPGEDFILLSGKFMHIRCLESRVNGCSDKL